MVFVPKVQADQVVAVAERIAAREALMAEALDRGLAPTEVLGTDYEELLLRLRDT